MATGSNRGDRAEYLRRAKVLLTERIGPLRYASAVVETAAWGRTEQADFMNQVLVLELGGAAGAALREGPVSPAVLHDLLDRTQAIERALGRTRELHWGPRTLDVDLIFLGDVRYEGERLSLPHPWWRQRAFVRDLLPPGWPTLAGT